MLLFVAINLRTIIEELKLQ